MKKKISAALRTHEKCSNVEYCILDDREKKERERFYNDE